jgi:hypothetical protein
MPCSPNGSYDDDVRYSVAWIDLVARAARSGAVLTGATPRWQLG